MDAEDVLLVVRTFEADHLRVWIDGGWGVDALLGEQTRDHGDLDLVVELPTLDHLLAAAGRLGFALTADHLPIRAVLRSMDGRQIDLHPVTFDDSGTGWQIRAAPDGSDCPYPATGFGVGEISNEVVPCLTPQLQMAHHLGYEPSDKDRCDMAALGAAFGIQLPEPYGPLTTDS
jgi:lincosamide nucleotidyltransferase A/C/D/E